MLANSYHNPLLTHPPLRRRSVCIVISVVLLVVLALAVLIQLSALASMPPDMASVFVTALTLSGLLSVVPLALLWLLDRREREGACCSRRRFSGVDASLPRLPCRSTSRSFS